MKQIKKYLLIKEFTFKLNLNVFLNYSFDELNNFLKKQNCSLLDKKYSEDKGMAFVGYRNKIPFHCIWIKEFNDTWTECSLLAHELTHIVFGFIEHLNLPIENPRNGTNETYAYLFEYFFLALNKRISKFYAKRLP